MIIKRDNFMEGKRAVLKFNYNDRLRILIERKSPRPVINVRRRTFILNTMLK